jgi:hypothetical protein
MGRFHELGRIGRLGTLAKLRRAGLATVDLDNDRWPDVVVTTNGGAPVVLHNRG